MEKVLFSLAVERYHKKTLSICSSEGRFRFSTRRKRVSMVIPLIESLQTFSEYDRAIVLVRDPLSAFLAEFNRQKGEGNRSTSKHVALAPLSAFLTSQEWPQFVQDKFIAWLGFNRNAVQYYSKENLCTIVYEQLTIDPVKGLEPCLQFLGFQLVNPMLKCLEIKAEGQFHRSTRPEEEIDKIMQKIPQQLMQEIQQKKYESMQHLLANSIHSGFGYNLYGKL